MREPTVLSFYVPGDPVPQGSTRAFARNGRAFTTDDPSGRIERWRGDIRTAARETMAREWGGDLVPATGSVTADLMFRIRRPRSHFLPVNSRRPEPVLRSTAPLFVLGSPDLDKLTRAVLDALTGVLYDDDSQVVSLGQTRKIWGWEAGVLVRFGLLWRPMTIGEVSPEVLREWT